MRTECASQLCDRLAVARYAVEPSTSIVRLVPCTAGVVGTPLCRSHADRLVAPVGWTIHDERPVVEASGGDRSIEPAIDGESAAASDLEDLLDARTPLLSRAFRAVSPVHPDESTRSRSTT